MKLTGLLVALLLAVTSLALSATGQRTRPSSASKAQVCRERLLNWAGEKDIGIRVFYAPLTDKIAPFKFPRVFVPTSAQDPRLGKLYGYTLYVLPKEVESLLRKLYELDLNWKAHSTPTPLRVRGPQLPTVAVHDRVQVIVSCDKGSCEAFFDGDRFCAVLAGLDSALTTPRALWEFQGYRVNFGCKVPEYDPHKFGN